MSSFDRARDAISNIVPKNIRARRLLTAAMAAVVMAEQENEGGPVPGFPTYDDGDLRRYVEIAKAKATAEAE